MTVEERIKEFKFRKNVETRWSDMDDAGHVNNAVYLTYFEQARVFYFHEACQWNWKKDGVILANAHLNYVKPLVFPEPAFIYLKTSRIGTKSFEVQYIITVEKDDLVEEICNGSSVLVTFDYKSGSSVPVPDFIRKQISLFESVNF
jgi:acyl-CoA thioester hydrolase